MSTFLEFYQALIRFVNYKLFIDIGFKYPLDEGQRCMQGDGIFLDSERVREVQLQVRKKFDSGQKQAYKISDEFKDTPEMKQLTQK